MEEIWIGIDNLDYEISNLGNLKSKDRIILYSDGRKRFFTGKNIKYRSDKDGYFVYPFLIGGCKKYLRIHRIIAAEFISNPLNLPEVNHKDGNKSNNKVNNLEWSSTIDNLKHAKDTGLNKGYLGKKIVQKDKNDNIIKIWNSREEASKTLFLDRAGIWRCIAGKLKTCGGYKWKLV